MTGFLSGTFMLGACVAGLAACYGGAWDALAACWGAVWALMVFGAVAGRVRWGRRPPSVAATARRTRAVRYVRVALARPEWTAEDHELLAEHGILLSREQEHGC